MNSPPVSSHVGFRPERQGRPLTRRRRVDRLLLNRLVARGPVPWGAQSARRWANPFTVVRSATTRVGLETEGLAGAISRKGFLRGMGCAAAGAALGALGHRRFAME